MVGSPPASSTGCSENLYNYTGTRWASSWAASTLKTRISLHNYSTLIEDFLTTSMQFVVVILSPRDLESHSLDLPCNECRNCCPKSTTRLLQTRSYLNAESHFIFLLIQRMPFRKQLGDPSFLLGSSLNKVAKDQLEVSNVSASVVCSFNVSQTHNSLNPSLYC